MVWIVDDLTEAALGPWGLAVAAGVGILTATRQWKSSSATAAAPGGSGPAGSVVAGSGAAGGLGGVVAVADGVKGRVQGVLAEACEYWRDLYAEAHSEWERGRTGSGSTVAAATATAPAVTSGAQTPLVRGTRVRGPNGRFVKA
jgi:hypothetical protein